MGIVLAVTSFAAAIYFLFIVAKAKKELPAYRSEKKREKIK